MIRTVPKSHTAIAALLLGTALSLGAMGSSRAAMAQGPESVADLA